jgi:hypothetical protein
VVQAPAFLLDLRHLEAHGAVGEVNHSQAAASWTAEAGLATDDGGAEGEVVGSCEFESGRVLGIGHDGHVV